MYVSSLFFTALPSLCQLNSLCYFRSQDEQSAAAAVSSIPAPEAAQPLRHRLSPVVHRPAENPGQRAYIGIVGLKLLGLYINTVEGFLEVDEQIVILMD